MKSFAQRRQESIDQAREDAREPFHSSCTDFPAPFLALAAAMDVGDRAYGQPIRGEWADVEVGDYGDGYEAARRLLSRDVRRGEFTDRFGASTSPSLEDQQATRVALRRLQNRFARNGRRS